MATQVRWTDAQRYERGLWTRIGRGCPHTFTARRIREVLLSSRFQICADESESYEEAKRKDCEAESLRARLKGYVGVSEFEYRSICEKVVGTVRSFHRLEC